VVTRHEEADRTTKRWWLHHEEDDLDEEGLRAASLDMEQEGRQRVYSL
jgi:hypothetical protein